MMNRSKNRLEKKEKMVSRSSELPTQKKMIVKRGPKSVVGGASSQSGTTSN